MSDPVRSGKAALLIIDMLNRLDFGGGETMRPHAEVAADVIAGLRDQADAAGAGVIYCNDNHGDWSQDRAELVAAALAPDSRGRAIAERLRPRDNDYLVVKPQFSAFYATTLPAVLPRLGVSRLVLTGIAADICVLFTAADAHMREYELWVPADAVASEHEQRKAWALDIIALAMSADTRPTTELSLDAWLSAGA
jgi:nicotinamidase-related amidase